MVIILASIGGVGVADWNMVQAQDPTPEIADLCVREFLDNNANGQFDSDEPNLNGVSIYVYQEDNVVGSMTTTPDEDCVALEPGTYRVVMDPGAAYQPTTPSTVVVTLIDSFTVNFGAIEATDETNALSNGTTSSPPDTTALPIATNQICVLVYNDLNTNRFRDGAEGLIGGIDVNLMMDGVIIQTLITNSQDYACFTGLPAGTFRVVVPDSPAHLMTTSPDATVEFVVTGYGSDIDLGAVRLDPFTQDALLPDYSGDEDNLVLDQEARLLLAVLGSSMMMLLMIGLGAVFLGIRRR
jgi:hypothetical protein